MKNKNVIFTAMLIATTFTFTATAQAGKEGGGGNSDAQAAKETIDQTFSLLSQAYGSEMVIDEQAIPLAKIVQFLATTKVVAVTGPLLNNGQPVDALNFPAKNLIEFDRDKFPKAHQRRLLIHEVLGLASINDHTYMYSGDIENEYDRLFMSWLSSSPIGSQFQSANQAWAQSRFSSVKEAQDFIKGKSFSCSWIGWSHEGQDRFVYADGSQEQNLHLLPNEWHHGVPDEHSDATDIQPAVGVVSSPLGDIVSIGTNALFDSDEPATGGPAMLKNGQVTTNFIYSNIIFPQIYPGKVRAMAGKTGNRIFIKLQESAYSSNTDYETIYICDPVVAK